MKRYGKSRNSRGFTLIELLVVIAMLAVLGTIAGISSMQIKKSIESKARKTYLTTSWNTTTTYLSGLNAGVLGTSPSTSMLNAKFGDTRVQTISKSACTKNTSLSNGRVYVQYKENDSGPRYTLVEIVYKKDGVYYYTANGGKTISKK